MQALLLAGQAEAIEGKPESLQAPLEAAPRPQLLQRRVGLLADQPGQPLQVAWFESRRRSASVRLGGERAGGAATLEQADDKALFQNNFSKEHRLPILPLWQIRQ